MPAPSLAMLPLTVLLTMVSVPALKAPPPKPAVLPLRVLSVMVNVAASPFKIPPPKLPWPFLIVRPENRDSFA